MRCALCGKITDEKVCPVCGYEQKSTAKAPTPKTSRPTRTTTTVTQKRGMDRNALSKVQNLNSQGIQALFRDHFLMVSKKKGECAELLGDVIAVVFFINDAVSSWNEHDKNIYIQKHTSAMTRLVDAAHGMCVDLKVRNAFGEITVPYDCTADNRYQWIGHVMQQYNKNWVTEYQKHYRREYNCDQAPIIFAFNKDFRCYAVSAEKGFLYVDEYSVVCKNCSERTIIHELLHQFGAADLYYPRRLYQVIKDRYHPSIMFHGTGFDFDPLTAYLIGWRNNIDNKTAMMLQDTKHIAMEEVLAELNQIYE